MPSLENRARQGCASMCSFVCYYYTVRNSSLLVCATLYIGYCKEKKRTACESDSDPITAMTVHEDDN